MEQAVEIFVPALLALASALALVWFRAWFLHRRARREIETSMWRLLIDSTQSLSSQIEGLEKIGSRNAEGHVTIGLMRTVPTESNLASELVRLDHQNSYLYHRLIARLAVLDEGYAFFRQLLIELFSSREDRPKKLSVAVHKQARGLQKDMLDTAELELEVLECLARNNDGQRGVDRQEISKARAELVEAREIYKNRPSFEDPVDGTAA